MNSPLNSLGINKDPKDTRVVVAMSGGVDSSVVAALLHEQGYEVIGVTLQLYDAGDQVAKSKTCCAGQDIYDAKKVADERGFAHYVLNYESNFREAVIDDFADSYIRGETPIPCVKCNQSVKFHDLLNMAHDLGADCMATGHYIKRVHDDETGCAALYRAHDHGKDQSYFLFATTQEQLDFLRFPLGGWSKDKTRAEAKRLNLITADKPDSQDICFVPDGDYAKIVTKVRPESAVPGDILHLDGRLVGQHEGIIHYTIGQRRGLKLGGGISENNAPLYVIEINAQAHQVIVGPKEALARNMIMLQDCNWLQEGLVDERMPVELKFRSVMKPVPGHLVRAANDERAALYLDTPQYGISPGQAAVCYQDDRVIGGGWITTTENTTNTAFGIKP